MSYLQEVPPDQATGVLRELYEQDLKEDGYVGHSTSIFSLHPEVLDHWKQTLRAIRSRMRLRVTSW